MHQKPNRSRIITVELRGDKWHWACSHCYWAIPFTTSRRKDTEYPRAKNLDAYHEHRCDDYLNKTSR
jgi:hypothetical protein